MPNVDGSAASFWDASSLALWLAAAVLLALLVLMSLVADILLTRRRDAAARILRAALFVLLPAMTLVPGVLLADRYGAGVGVGVLMYVVFFALFCYYLGRRVGRVQGRTSISELVGLDGADSIEDAQDRLFESRMRFPNRADVVKSIGEMAKANETARRAEERAAVGRPMPGVPEVAGEIVLTDERGDKQP